MKLLKYWSLALNDQHHYINAANIALLVSLQFSACSESHESFVENSAGTVQVQVENKGQGDAAAVVPVPRISSAEAHKILAEMDHFNSRPVLSTNSTSEQSFQSETVSTSKSLATISQSNNPGLNTTTITTSVSANPGLNTTTNTTSASTLAVAPVQSSMTQNSITTTTTTVSPGSSDPLTLNEIKACAALVGTSEDKIVRISGNENSITLKSTDVVAVKVTGNQNRVNLDMSKKSGSIRGICIFAAGNQSKIVADLSVNCGKLVYIARGNRTIGDIHVGVNGSIDSKVVDLGGNKSTLRIHGEGVVDTLQSVVRGDSSGLVCSARNK